MFLPMACEICKKTNSLKQNVIFPLPSQPLPIMLCASHDQELFLKGQYRFVKKYRNQLRSDFRLPEKEKNSGEGEAA